MLLRGVGLRSLARHQGLLTDWVAVHPVASSAMFELACVLTAALSLPQAALLSVAGGLLFGSVVGCAVTVTGATVGALGTTVLRGEARFTDPATISVDGRAITARFRWMMKGKPPAA